MIVMNVLPPSGQEQPEGWNPAAAIGLTCADCHPEGRDTAPEVRPDNGNETACREVYDDSADEPFTDLDFPSAMDDVPAF
ncbi:hypothetical protein ACIF80_16600 [Streptomyces sp. NPDC085927]|uniref:hypothetical protein n=1 Tax=Streptomyces sp. NPDC085927 TaxID=3365738 RepID=UPI0037D6993F